ncbi:hypothetical protein MLD38_002525 [Melastoma candidum]|uniref:Uncharacterized protein n=1 Tax=Melastoma candidum TaxID=119954 RepID=A0ACB9RZC4_9MYRT|nr:hypothetical protein MLD38_002525 [Melastoma candidum]
MSKQALFVPVLLVLLSAWVYSSLRPPPPSLCGSPGGPPVTAPRIVLRDGRHLAYKEHGVPRDAALHKIIFVHGFGSCRHEALIATDTPSEIIDELGVYVASFDKPGYGESDPDPKRTTKSLALDIEELGDRLGLGARFYVAGFSMGGQAIWGCLKYIPHRLAGAVLIAPVVNFWWPGFPTNLSTQAYAQQPLSDQWALRVAHHAPWLNYWWNTQKWFAPSSVFAGSPRLSRQDMELSLKLVAEQQQSYRAEVKQQGEFESICRDMMIGFGKWEFDPMELEDPFPNKEEGRSVHLWQGDEDTLVPISLQRYIVGKLPWIRYHEITGAGHMFPKADGMSESIVRTLLYDR